MGLLSEVLPPSNVLVDIEAKSVKKLFELMSIFFYNRYGVDRYVIYQKFFYRERLGSTVLPGTGLAIPRVFLVSLSDILCSLVRLKESVVFDQSEEEASLFLFVLSSYQQRSRVVEVYQEVLQLIAQEDALSIMRQVHDAAALHQYVCQTVME